MELTLPQLPYAYDSLAPYMSKETLEYHHDKHHLAYITKANELLKDTDPKGSLENLVKASHDKDPVLFNNVSQHYNHFHFWMWMKPQGGGKIPSELEAAIIESFGSVEKMKDDFVQAGVSQFGSGWHWLAVKNRKLVILKTANAENPLLTDAVPILGNDVWEHSYYIDYRNRRPDYCKAFIEHLVNWDYVAQCYDAAKKASA